MNIEDLTVKQVREIAALFQPTKSGDVLANHDVCPYVIGKTYLIRTVTMIDTGVVVRVTDKEIVLTDAAWIADTGRFADAVKKAEFSEVEPFPDGEVIINRSAVIDAVAITKSPRSQK